MRLLLIGSLLFTGGGAVAMQNETVNEEVNQLYQRARIQVQKRVKHNLIEQVKDTGFPYPPQAYLDTLTDEQEALIVTTIDQINANYDWPNMTDEEIVEALQVAKDELAAVYEELGLEMPNVREQIQERIQERIQQRSRRRILNAVKENGIAYPHESVLEELTEEQVLAVTTLIDDYNNTYDWATMTTEDIVDALTLFHEDMTALKDELGIDIPLVRTPQERFWAHVKDRYINFVQSNGIPYPAQDVLEALTEEQQAAVIELIDEYNNTYDWATMTDDEVFDILKEFRTDMAELKDELGIDAPLRGQPQPNVGQGTKSQHQHGNQQPCQGGTQTPNQDNTTRQTPDETDEA